MDEGATWHSSDAPSSSRISPRVRVGAGNAAQCTPPHLAQDVAHSPDMGTSTLQPRLTSGRPESERMRVQEWDGAVVRALVSPRADSVRAERSGSSEWQKSRSWLVREAQHSNAAGSGAVEENRENIGDGEASGKSSKKKKRRHKRGHSDGGGGGEKNHVHKLHPMCSFRDAAQVQVSRQRVTRQRLECKPLPCAPFERVPSVPLERGLRKASPLPSNEQKRPSSSSPARSKAASSERPPSLASMGQADSKQGIFRFKRKKKFASVVNAVIVSEKMKARTRELRREEILRRMSTGDEALPFLEPDQLAESITIDEEEDDDYAERKKEEQDLIARFNKRGDTPRQQRMRRERAGAVLPTPHRAPMPSGTPRRELKWTNPSGSMTLQSPASVVLADVRSSLNTPSLEFSDDEGPDVGPVVARSRSNPDLDLSSSSGGAMITGEDTSGALSDSETSVGMSPGVMMSIERAAEAYGIDDGFFAPSPSRFVSDRNFKPNHVRKCSPLPALTTERDSVNSSLEVSGDGGDSGGQWNEQFQQILERVASFDANTAISTQADVYQRLISLVEDFLHCVNMYGKIIISEVYLDDYEKTIPPVRMGGAAGGCKYMVQDILFKFAVDFEGMYGHDDAAAAKVAGHELKGLQAYFNCEVKGLCFPLMALVDYRGFRVIAMSVLPIDNNTLVYGTNDGGHTMVNCSKTCRTMMKAAGGILNLKTHLAGLNTDTRKVVYSAADVEGHRGMDNRFYVIDFARTFPCETPRDKEVPGINLTRLFRPEFVKEYRHRLCPDAYTRFCDIVYCTDTDSATSYLRDTVVPLCAVDLPIMLQRMRTTSTELSLETGQSEIHNVASSGGVIELLHQRGVNMRHGGLVYLHMSRNAESEERDKAMAMLLLEMVARVAKNDLRERLRENMQRFRRPVKEAHHLLVIHYLNVLVGLSGKSNQYWSDEIETRLINKFEGINLIALRHDCRSRNRRDREVCDLSSSAPAGFKKSFSEFVTNQIGDWRLILLRRLENMFALRINDAALQAIVETVGKSKKWDSASPLQRADLVEMGVKVKHMNIVSYAEGFVYMTRAFRRDADGDEVTTNLQRAVAKFESVLASYRNNKSALRMCATCLLQLAMESKREKKNAKDKASASRLLATAKQCTERAVELMTRAIRVDPNDAQSLRLYANYLETTDNLDLAEEHYLLALEADPSYSAAVHEYAMLLDRNGEKELATSFLLARPTG